MSVLLAPLLSVLLQYEESAVQRLGWPLWACRSIEVLVGIICLLMLLQGFLRDRVQKKKDKDDSAAAIANKQKSQTPESLAKRAETDSKFFWFQFQYLSVYFIVMLADWLQGTNMYTLYKSYNVNVGYLFLTGFLSSAIFGTFVGIYVDKYGRKFGCIVFCILEIIINLLEHIPSMPVLIFGRILGGISTQLLFSAFESWMVTAHRQNSGFTDEGLSRTFTISATGNGITAIVAGIIAQYSADVLGDIGPFQVAIALTVLALIVILPWKENYGHSENNESKKEADINGGISSSNDSNTTSSNNKISKADRKRSKNDDKNDSESESLIKSINDTFSYIKRHPLVLFLGLSQAIFEGAVYTFVFMWVPVLLTVKLENSTLPTGLVFSSFMLSMAIGGMLTDILLSLVTPSQKNFCILSLGTYVVAAISMYVPVVYFDFWSIFVSFLVLEAMVGMFYAMSGNMRSILYPQHLQSSIMSLFRFPLNIIVVVGTKMTDSASEQGSYSFVFVVLVIMHSSAALLQLFMYISSKSSSSGGDDGDDGGKKGKNKSRKNKRLVGG